MCYYLYLRGRHVNSQCDQRQDQYDVGKRIVWNTQTAAQVNLHTELLLLYSYCYCSSSFAIITGRLLKAWVKNIQHWYQVSSKGLQLVNTHRADLLPRPAAQWGWGRSRERRRCSWSDQTCPDRMLSSLPTEDAAASSAPSRTHSRSTQWCSWRRDRRERIQSKIMSANIRHVTIRWRAHDGVRNRRMAWGQWQIQFLYKNNT